MEEETLLKDEGRNCEFTLQITEISYRTWNSAVNRTEWLGSRVGKISALEKVELECSYNITKNFLK